MSGIKRFSVVFLLISALLLSLFGCDSGSTAGQTDAASTAQTLSERLTEAVTSAERESETETEKETSATSAAEKETAAAAEQSTDRGEETTAEAQTSETEKKTEKKTVKFTLFNREGKTSEPVGDAFFKDAVFIGDSVTMALRNYVTSQRNKGNTCLADAKFLTAGSMGYSNSLLPENDPECIRPKLNGKKVTLADGVKELGAKKVFIMLGMNDFAAYKHETAVNNAKKAVEGVLAKNPDARIYIQSITPVLASKERGKFTNDNIDDMNARLEEMCEENGWTYLDVNSVFKGSDGCLIPSYCSDPDGQGIHLTSAGCKKWVECLDSSF